MKILDKIVDWLLEKLNNYKFKRRIKKLKEQDPFIYP